MSTELPDTLIDLDTRAEHYVVTLRALLKADAERSMTETGADGSCVVYFVQEGGGGAIKIGVTKNLKSRLATLRVNAPREMNVLAHVPGDERLETYLHDRFRGSHIRGEWYRSTPELFACIEELKTGPPVLSDSERLLVEEASKTWARPFAERPKRTKRKWH
jgi:hypothetical protein